MLDPALDNQVGLNRSQKLAKGRFGQQVLAPDPRRQAGEQVIQQQPSAFAPDFCGLFQGPPFALQRQPHRLPIELSHREATAAAFATPVAGNAAQNPP